MRRLDTGGDAFPRPEFADNGMTLRDWFAGHGLAGLLASGNEASGGSTDANYARLAYCLADAMLAARATGKGEG